MKILNILSSINGEHSNTKKVVEAINSRLLEKHPDATINVKDLAKSPVPHLEAAHFQAFYATEELPENYESNVFHSDTAISEIKESDIIVIAVPFYNFNVPGTLKSWIDQIARAGVTFSYGENGPIGLLQGKKVFLAFASGGIYSVEPMKSMDFAEPYLRNVLGFLGMTDITTFRLEGVKVPGVSDHALDKVHKEIEAFEFA
ncbi:NAD(P)H-dependent oxidoreductase [Flavobacterium sp. MAH-1]|uniref:FMN dependent NADH:quinone oxidoreductase n=1 Tax=Flavobacterium agri TaxID=2743471 RepID=A0A7Y8Y241_9FLAO|nr:NAD(P)H-dependent oxidoreductase [Flavobacterium agri]NUY81175.1 NAD(P)H-dependent oxidoreductase [Flavobacterium agri]NYA71199.1 NAD(P)H-dependent oxidoreductase [Flavobacterium agri]